jgi:flagellar biosynthetic protein FlhB
MDGPAGLLNLGSLVFPAVMLLLVKMVLPLAVMPLAIVAGSLWPGGWIFSLTNLQPKLERFNPANLGRLFSGKHLSEFGLSLFKVGVLLAVLWHVVRPR